MERPVIGARDSGIPTPAPSDPTAFGLQQRAEVPSSLWISALTDALLALASNPSKSRDQLGVSEHRRIEAHDRSSSFVDQSVPLNRRHSAERLEKHLCW